MHVPWPGTTPLPRTGKGKKKKRGERVGGVSISRLISNQMEFRAHWSHSTSRPGLVLLHSAAPRLNLPAWLADEIDMTALTFFRLHSNHEIICQHTPGISGYYTARTLALDFTAHKRWTDNKSIFIWPRHLEAEYSQLYYGLVKEQIGK